MSVYMHPCAWPLGGSRMIKSGTYCSEHQVEAAKRDEKERAKLLVQRLKNGK